MISALSKYGAASSAKRIISTAEMAKLGATTQLGPSSPPNSWPHASKSASCSPVVPTTAWMPCMARNGTVRRAASADVKSTTTWQPASTKARGSAWISTPSIELPGGRRVDGGDELELGIEGDRPADRRPHPPPGPGHTHLDRHGANLGAVASSEQ